MITVLWGAPALAMAEAMPFRSEARFPLTVAPSGRFLVDAVGTPFLLCGDAAWSLVAELTREDAEIYLEDRRARGFNAVLASVVEHHFSTHPPTNAYGQQPFLMPGDFSTPNDAYFRHLDWLVRRAGEKGLLVMLAPAYLGIGGGEQGWYAEMAANGPERLRQYGHYLGSRYRDAANILWVHGGDYDPPDRALVAAVAEGIREVAPNGLHTIHGAPETVVDEYWREAAPWLQLNSLYTYRPVAAKASAAYDRAQTIPFILLESAYENEHGTTARDLRAQAYQALL
ncbi:MAG TPA: DUF4038 domain-containing protein, partial [Magnetospirillum sp.]|nr:DUF4038 domain-containing protein [Magnetospirillum sp.]